jgi:hypothetical protein
MRFRKVTAPLSAILTLTLLFGCGGGAGTDAGNSNVAGNTAAETTSKANTNAEELGLLINFSWETEDLAWKRDDARKTLVAAFRLSPEDVKKLSDQLSSKGQGAPKEVAVEEWFPAELVAQGESRGSSTVPATAFPANDFYQPPYTEGTISRVDSTDYFVIELNAQ